MACSNTAWLKSPYILVFHPLTVDLTIILSLVASFSDLHLSFQSRFSRLSLSPLRFPFFFCPVHLSSNEKSHILNHRCIYMLIKRQNIQVQSVQAVWHFCSLSFFPFLCFSTYTYLHYPGRKEEKKYPSPPILPLSEAFSLTHAHINTQSCFYHFRGHYIDIH